MCVKTHFGMLFWPSGSQLATMRARLALDRHDATCYILTITRCVIALIDNFQCEGDIAMATTKAGNTAGTAKETAEQAIEKTAANLKNATDRRPKTSKQPKKRPPHLSTRHRRGLRTPLKQSRLRSTR